MTNPKSIIAKATYSPKRIWRKLMVTISTSAFIHYKVRLRLLKWAGVKFKGQAFIGSNVTFDGINPELITIGEGAVITSGTCILTHFYSTRDSLFYIGEVNIGDKVFIGMNTLIVNAVNIGDNAVIGAGSIVTCDIPAGEVWAGNPARFIKKLTIEALR